MGRSSSRYAEMVSDSLRRANSPDLARRRAASALTLAAMAALEVVAAYQTGLLRRLPEPPLLGLDADRVDASGEAYRTLGTPDAALGLISYGLTLALVAAGPEDRARRSPWLPVLAAGKVAGDAASAGYLFAEQVTKHKAICTWCTAAAAASLASLPLVLPEALRSWRVLHER